MQKTQVTAIDLLVDGATKAIPSLLCSEKYTDLRNNLNCLDVKQIKVLIAQAITQILPQYYEQAKNEWREALKTPSYELYIKDLLNVQFYELGALILDNLEVIK